MNRILRILLFAGLLTLTVVLFAEARAANRAAEVDASKIVLLFVSVVIVGGATAVLFVVTVIPSIGDAIGNLFFQPNEQVERDPHRPGRKLASAVGEDVREPRLVELHSGRG